MCVYGSVYLCAFVHICVCMGVCAFGHTCTHAQTRTCTRLNASLGNCLNGIRGDYGSCWGDGTVGMTWENTHVAFTAQTAMLLVDSKQRWLCGDSLYPKDTSGPWLLCKLAKKRYDTPFSRVETCKTKYSNNESALICGSRVRLHCTCEVWDHFLVADYFTCSKARGQSRRLNEHHRELKVDEWRAGGGNMHCKILTSRGHLWHNVRSAVSAVFNISDFQPVMTKVAFVCGFLWRIKIWDTDNFRRKCLPVLLIQKQFGAFLCKFACSPCACVGSLQTLPFLPTVQRHACLHNWWYLNWPQVP